MRDIPEIVKVDIKTWEDFSDTLNELAGFLEWLEEKGDAEAHDKLKPIALKMAF